MTQEVKKEVAATKTPDQKAFDDLVGKIQKYRQTHSTDEILGYTACLIMTLREMIEKPTARRIVLMRQLGEFGSFGLGRHFTTADREILTPPIIDFVQEFSKWIVPRQHPLKSFIGETEIWTHKTIFQGVVRREFWSTGKSDSRIRITALETILPKPKVEFKGFNPREAEFHAARMQRLRPQGLCDIDRSGPDQADILHQAIGAVDPEMKRPFTPEEAEAAFKETSPEDTKK